MRILEIKNSLIKISYDVEDNLALSSFVIVEDKNTPYVAQVVNLKAESGRNFAVLKLLFTFNEEGVLKTYDGTIPSLEASVTKLPTEELLEVIPADSPIYLGSIANQEVPFKLDATAFESNMLICSDSVENSSKILSNILPQMVELGNKIVLLDVNGDFSSEDSFVFGKDFELPLNKQFLEFIFDNDLDGVAPVSKAVIQDIFREVEDYIETLPQGYLPIDLFINVVQEQYKETGIPELVLLKNKLLNYQENNVFAATGDNVSILRDKIAHTDMLVVDISGASDKLQNLLIPYMFDCVSTVNANTYVLLSMNNDIADKKLLRKTLEFNNIYTTIICSHNFKYLPDLKQIIQNMILLAPQTVQHDFAAYNTFLSKLNSDEFVVYGPVTHNIPFVVQIVAYDELNIVQDETEEVVENVQVDSEQNSQVYDGTQFTEADIIEAEVVQPEMPDYENSELINEVQDIISDVETSNALDEVIDQHAEKVSDIVVDNEPSVLNNGEGVETLSFEQEAFDERENLVEQVAQDVDAAFYKKFDEETLDSENDINPDIFSEEDEVEELSETDLDFIQNIPVDSSQEETYSTDDFMDDFSKEAVVSELENDVMNPDSIEEFQVEDTMEFVDDDETMVDSQMVPIYTPEEFEAGADSGADLFQSGDVVSHPKYGQGVVEKMINYGNKTLCSISFVNIGRRLLDPTLSELTLVSRDGAIMN